MAKIAVYELKPKIKLRQSAIKELSYKTLAQLRSRYSQKVLLTEKVGPESSHYNVVYFSPLPRRILISIQLIPP